LKGFLSPDKYGFAILRHDQLARILSNQFALFFIGDEMRSNGDRILVQPWTFLNICKFCLEGFQYKTFLKFWEWRWG
jgi:hypothetical protein